MSDTTLVTDDTALLDRIQAPEGSGRVILDAATREPIGRAPQHSLDDLDDGLADPVATV